MQYNISIDQVRAKKWGMNLPQSFLFSYLFSASSWATRVNIEGEDFWFVSRTKIVEELPMVTEKPDTVYRLLLGLENLGVILYAKKGKQDCIQISKKGKFWNRKDSEVLYEISESSGEKENSEKNPSNSETRKKIRVSSENSPKKLGKFSDISCNHIIIKPENQKKKGDEKSGKEKIDALFSFLKGKTKVFKFQESDGERRKLLNEIQKNREEMGESRFLEAVDFLVNSDFHSQHCGKLKYLAKSIPSHVPQPKTQSSSSRPKVNRTDQKKAEKQEKEDEKTKILERKISDWINNPKKSESFELCKKHAEREFQKLSKNMQTETMRKVLERAEVRKVL